MRAQYIWFLYILLPVVIRCQNGISVGTYNLWNVMFSWDVRKHYIARMISESDLDVIGFQEVRFASSSGNNQILELQRLLQEYPYAAFHPASTVTLIENSYWRTWDSEGLGLLSKYPIIKHWAVRLPVMPDQDTNERITLQATIMKDDFLVNIVVVHLSYARRSQCTQVASIIDSIERQHSSNVIVLGDFNAYPDFEFPLRMFTDKDGKHSMCKVRKSDLPMGLRRLSFQDVASSDQLTFSNMPTPGLVSRPDRIIVSSHLMTRPQSVRVRGEGQGYKSLYRSSILHHRLKTLISAAHLTAWGAAGYPCLHTCGPNGVCRCGVCVERQEDPSLQDCDLPNCEECSTRVFFLFGVFLCTGLFVAATVAFAVVRILVVSSTVQQNQRVFEILGCNCCLCHPELFSGPLAPRPCRYRSALMRCNPLCWLTPYVSLATGLVLLLMTYLLACWVLARSLDTVYNVMAEEFFPSDHLMLSVSLVLNPKVGHKTVTLAQ